MRQVLVMGLALMALASDPRPRFRLAVAGPAPLASGFVELSPSPSPFALAVTTDGRVVYDLDISVHALPDPSSLGDYVRYEAWLATPDLGLVRDLGAIGNDVALRAHADWNKFTVVISAEPATAGATAAARWHGAIVLVGRSPSSLMQSFAGHSFYNTGMPPE